MHSLPGHVQMEKFDCLVTSATHIQAEDEPRELDFKTKLQRTLELQKKLHEQENENIEKAQACQRNKSKQHQGHCQKSEGWKI